MLLHRRRSLQFLSMSVLWKLVLTRQVLTNAGIGTGKSTDVVDVCFPCAELGEKVSVCETASSLGT